MKFQDCLKYFFLGKLFNIYGSSLGEYVCDDIFVCLIVYNTPKVCCTPRIRCDAIVATDTLGNYKIPRCVI